MIADTSSSNWGLLEGNRKYIDIVIYRHRQSTAIQNDDIFEAVQVRTYDLLWIRYQGQVGVVVDFVQS